MISFKEIAKSNTISISGKIQTEDLGTPFGVENTAYGLLLKLKNQGKIPYPMIDLEFLAMQNADGTPKFATFRMDNPEFYIDVCIEFYQNGRHGIEIRSNLETGKKQILSYYKKFITKMARSCWEKSLMDANVRSVTMKSSTRFSGLIPEDVRKEIRSVNSKVMFDNVLLIAEASSWTMESKTVKFPPNPDPMVVGLKDNVFYLISVFDLTPMETYITKEFTDKKE